MTEVVLLDLTGEISMAFSDRPLNPKTLQIEKKIAGARLEVYKVYSSSRKSVYALKIYPKNTFGTTKYQNEKLMIPLRHQNVIRSIPIICNDDRFNAILTEFAHHGDFFDLVTKGLVDTEVLMRTYFHHLIEGLEYIHSNGLAHLDIKLENLMLGADFRLKIIDFDQAQPIVEEQILSKGTSCSRAPEVIDGTCRDLAAADIYSAGIILFAFKAGVFPFLEIDDTRKGKHLRSSSVFNADNTRFWRMKAQMKGTKTFFCKDFISLMNGMLHFDVEKRFKVCDIKNSKWYKGTIIDDESLQTIMKTKLEELKKKEEAKLGRF